MKNAIVIDTRDDADRCLQRIGELERYLENAENDIEVEVYRLREGMLAETAPAREALAKNRKALEAWTKGDAKNWGKEKHLDLNWGKVGLRRPPAAIKLLLALENVIEKLRAKKLTSCIRVIEEVDKEALANYDDATIAAVGCKRTKPKDRFWYETKKEEIRD
jgi:phage host-nuclease inhibitor protein Gam